MEFCEGYNWVLKMSYENNLKGITFKFKHFVFKLKCMFNTESIYTVSGAGVVGATVELIATTTIAANNNVVI